MDPLELVTAQLLFAVTNPEQPQPWLEALESGKGDPAKIIGTYIGQMLPAAVQASGGRVTPEIAEQALRQVVMVMVMIAVKGGAIPAEISDQVMQAALQAAQGGGQQQQQPPQQPPQQPGGAGLLGGGMPA